MHLKRAHVAGLVSSIPLESRQSSQLMVKNQRIVDLAQDLFGLDSAV